MDLRVVETGLAGAVIIENRARRDERGFFYEAWNAKDFAAAGLPLTFVQENHSRSARGVLRGVHYQDATAPLGKLVRCTVGRVYDVAVDLRLGSPTFGRWKGVELSGDNMRQFYLPPGFGHAFQALEDGAEVQYKQTGFYAPNAERIIAWNDPDLAIAWPIAEPELSERDRRGASLKAYAAQPAFRFEPL